MSDDQPVIEGTLDCDSRFFGVVVAESDGRRAPIIPSEWLGARVRVMRREGHATEWIVIERRRE